ncbi:MAG: dienelactone hydrolase family protein [Caulobacter sp.]|nr:dienelactone hydrolase family protein [Caulobacter sp.]
MADIDALKDYERLDFTDGPWTRPVFKRGTGPAVIIIHEIPGLHPLVVRYADGVAAAGFTVYLPSLFGQPGKTVTTPYALGQMFMNICVRREFNVWANGRSSPIVDWLRALARKAHAECGGPGVGALGMCFTGGYALAMMTEPSVIAPVLSQPSMPVGKGRERAIDCSAAEIACAKRRFQDEDLSLLGLAFEGDGFVPPGRFDMLRETFGDRFEGVELKQEDGQQGTGVPSHSVLTIHLARSGPTREAEARTLSFFRQRLRVDSPAAGD